MATKAQMARLQSIRDAGERAANEGKHEYKDNPYDSYAPLAKGKDYLDSDACAAETWLSGFRYARRMGCAVRSAFDRTRHS